MDIFPVGSRAIVTSGPTAIGFVESGGPLVRDASLGKGLPARSHATVSFLTGDWPTWLLAVSGSFAGSGNPGDHHAYVRRNGAWTRLDGRAHRGWDRPSSVAWDKDSLWVFAPDGFYLANGVLLAGQYPCAGSHRLKTARLGRTKKASSTPEVDADFFPREIVADGKGGAFVWGWSACKPGLFAGRLEGEQITLEVAPGTEACGERAEGNGLPDLRGRAFPAADGGIYILVFASIPGTRAAVCAGPTVFHRHADGTWSRRVLPRGSAAWSTENAAPYVAPDGTLWAVTAQATVVSWTERGQVTEYPLDPSCATLQVNRDGEEQTLALDPTEPISKIVAASPGDIWLVVQYDRIGGLCRLGGPRGQPDGKGASSKPPTKSAP